MSLTEDLFDPDKGSIKLAYTAIIAPHKLFVDTEELVTYLSYDNYLESISHSPFYDELSVTMIDNIYVKLIDAIIVKLEEDEYYEWCNTLLQLKNNFLNAQKLIE